MHVHTDRKDRGESRTHLPEEIITSGAEVGDAFVGVLLAVDFAEINHWKIIMEENNYGESF